MYKLTDLKSFYGTETLMEVLETNPAARETIFRKDTKRNGKLVILTTREEYGLVALDTHILGYGVIIKLTEPYLETLMITSNEYHDIIGCPYSERPRLNLDEEIKQVKLDWNDKRNRNEILGWGTVIGTVLVLGTIKLVSGKSIPSEPKSKRK